MVSSLALALSQIIPSLERFQTESTMQTITNSFLSLDASIKDLLSAEINTSVTVNYNLKSGFLDVDKGRLITLFLESNGVRFYNYSFYSGEVLYSITGNYRRMGGLIYLFGDPKILVYSLNRTTSITNIAYQTLDNEKIEKLYYDVFLAIEAKNQNIEVNIVILHLNTSTINGQKEYFPLINRPAKILVIKANQQLEQITLGLKSDELTVGAFTNEYSEKITYPTAPANFNLIVNLMHIFIDLRVS